MLQLVFLKNASLPGLKGFRRSEMYSQQLAALKIINFIDLLFKEFHFIFSISYPYTEPLITHY